MEPLRALGQRLSKAQEERLTSFDFEHARSRLLESVRPSRHRRARTAWGVALVAAVSAAVLMLMLRGGGLEFRVGLDEGSGETGEWIAAPMDRTVPITFSDGTELTLKDGARARVVDVSSVGATLIVERGELSAAVVPKQGARWQVFVGPYQVRVTGTRFDVGWHPETERFWLSLHEGSVVVSGPIVGAERSLRAGEELRVTKKDGELSLIHRDIQAAEEPAAEEARVDAAAVDGVTVAPPRAEPEELPRPMKKTRAQGADYRELARESKYREALAAAQRVGFDQLCQTATAHDLMLLADVARLAGDADRARQAYRRVRERFPGRDASQAAFFLGRLAFDQMADYDDAARYFALSIEEQPEGPLAREAAGRLIEAKVLLADAAGARDASRKYLRRHPDGPHAQLAKKLLAAP